MTSSFNLNAWKNEYSQRENEHSARWFWEHFDPEAYSIWRVDFNFNHTLTSRHDANEQIKAFRNSIEGELQYVYGSMIVRSEGENHNLSGYFVIHGQEVPVEITNSAHYSSYTFQKIEPSQYEEKKEKFNKYLSKADGIDFGNILK